MERVLMKGQPTEVLAGSGESTWTQDAKNLESGNLPTPSHHLPQAGDTKGGECYWHDSWSPREEERLQSRSCNPEERKLLPEVSEGRCFILNLHWRERAERNTTTSPSSFLWSAAYTFNWLKQKPFGRNQLVGARTEERKAECGSVAGKHTTRNSIT